MNPFLKRFFNWTGLENGESALFPSQPQFAAVEAATFSTEEEVFFRQ